MSLLERILGVPLSRARQYEEIETHLRFFDAAGLRATLSENLSHITQKSGALLGAQAIFLVVDTYGMDRGWPRIAVLISLVTLVVAALLVMGNLRSVFLAVRRETEDRETLEREALVVQAQLVGRRGAVFNIALYLTFLSVVLLGFGVVETAFA